MFLKSINNMDMRFLLRVLQCAFIVFSLLLHMSLVFAVDVQSGNTILKCKERERKALLDLKEKFAMLADHELSSWGNGENQKECCKWERVECNKQTGRVIKLHLSGIAGMSSAVSSGPLPTMNPSFAELHHLNYLDLSQSGLIQMEIPKFIGSLTQLKYLNLSSANFAGKIPRELGNLSLLRYLDLHSNLIIGKIPDELGNLSQLQYLNLGDNSLDGEFPGKLWNLSTLVHLDLHYNQLSGKIPLLPFNLSSSLKYLDLSMNQFIGTIPPNLGSLCNLQYLHISNNLRSDLKWISHLLSLQSLSLENVDLNSADNWLQEVSNLSHLQELNFAYSDLPELDSSSLSSTNLVSSSRLAILDLSYNKITSSIFPWLLNFKNSLTSLVLQGNRLSGPIPEALGNLGSLQVLDLTNNRLEGGIPKSLLDICSLRQLLLHGNKLSGQLDEFVGTSLHCSKNSLKVLSLSTNKITGSVPDLSQFSHLELLFLEDNALNGTVSEGIGQLSNLEELQVGHNSLRGVISEAHFSKLSKLSGLNMSFNALIFNISSDWIPPFQLNSIHLASCKLGPAFPRWLRTQKMYSSLDISNADISNVIPSWFWDLSPSFSILNLSHNHFSGEMTNVTLKNYLLEIDLSSNMFHGSIPSFFSRTSRLFLSNNKFSKTNSLLCGNTTKQTTILDLSSNQLTGELPDCWVRFKNLVYLDLTNNYFHGNIPFSMGALSHIEALHLGYNNFTGEIPLSLKNCKELRVFDAIQNKLSGPLPSWIGDGLENLLVLSLRSNLLHGNMPSSICRLAKLQLFDVSQNNITGSIPKCLNNLTSLASEAYSNATVTYNVDDLVNDQSTGSFGGGSTSVDDSASLTWKGKVSKFQNILGLVRSIDLSSNFLIGEVPSEIMNLVGLVSLNISRNKLSGEIPPTIGQLKSLDSLDLSRNNLSGKIPSQLSQISRLGVLDLSYNSLSGEIPIGTQLQSFNISTYMGNPHLCGAPLPKCPRKEIDEADNDDENYANNELFNPGLYISIALGFIVGFWGVCGSLLLKKSWRYAYFKFLNDVYEKAYVIAMVNKNKIQGWIRASM